MFFEKIKAISKYALNGEAACARLEQVLCHNQGMILRDDVMLADWLGIEKRFDQYIEFIFVRFSDCDQETVRRLVLEHILADEFSMPMRESIDNDLRQALNLDRLTPSISLWHYYSEKLSPENIGSFVVSETALRLSTGSLSKALDSLLREFFKPKDRAESLLLLELFGGYCRAEKGYIDAANKLMKAYSSESGNFRSIVSADEDSEIQLESLFSDALAYDAEAITATGGSAVEPTADDGGGGGRAPFNSEWTIAKKAYYLAKQSLLEVVDTLKIDRREYKAQLEQQCWAVQEEGQALYDTSLGGSVAESSTDGGSANSVDLREAAEGQAPVRHWLRPQSPVAVTERMSAVSPAVPAGMGEPPHLPIHQPLILKLLEAGAGDEFFEVVNLLVKMTESARSPSIEETRLKNLFGRFYAQLIELSNQVLIDGWFFKNLSSKLKLSAEQTSSLLMLIWKTAENNISTQHEFTIVPVDIPELVSAELANSDFDTGTILRLEKYNPELGQVYTYIVATRIKSKSAEARPVAMPATSRPIYEDDEDQILPAQAMGGGASVISSLGSASNNDLLSFWIDEFGKMANPCASTALVLTFMSEIRPLFSVTSFGQLLERYHTVIAEKFTTDAIGGMSDGPETVNTYFDFPAQVLLCNKFGEADNQNLAEVNLVSIEEGEIDLRTYQDDQIVNRVKYFFDYALKTHAGKQALFTWIVLGGKEVNQKDLSALVKLFAFYNNSYVDAFHPSNPTWLTEVIGTNLKLVERRDSIVFYSIGSDKSLSINIADGEFPAVTSLATLLLLDAWAYDNVPAVTLDGAADVISTKLTVKLNNGPIRFSFLERSEARLAAFRLWKCCVSVESASQIAACLEVSMRDVRHQIHGVNLEHGNVTTVPMTALYSKETNRVLTLMKALGPEYPADKLRRDIQFVDNLRDYLNERLQERMDQLDDKIANCVDVDVENCQRRRDNVIEIQSDIEMYVDAVKRLFSRESLDQRRVFAVPQLAQRPEGLSSLTVKEFVAAVSNYTPQSDQYFDPAELAFPVANLARTVTETVGLPVARPDESLRDVKRFITVLGRLNTVLSKSGNEEVRAEAIFEVVRCLDLLPSDNLVSHDSEKPLTRFLVAITAGGGTQPSSLNAELSKVIKRFCDIVVENSFHIQSPDRVFSLLFNGLRPHYETGHLARFAVDEANLKKCLTLVELLKSETVLEQWALVVVLVREVNLINVTDPCLFSITGIVSDLRSKIEGSATFLRGNFDKTYSDGSSRELLAEMRTAIATGIFFSWVIKSVTAISIQRSSRSIDAFRKIIDEIAKVAAELFFYIDHEHVAAKVKWGGGEAFRGYINCYRVVIQALDVYKSYGRDEESGCNCPIQQELQVALSRAYTCVIEENHLLKMINAAVMVRSQKPTVQLRALELVAAGADLFSGKKFKTEFGAAIHRDDYVVYDPVKFDILRRNMTLVSMAMPVIYTYTKRWEFLAMYFRNLIIRTESFPSNPDNHTLWTDLPRRGDLVESGLPPQQDSIKASRGLMVKRQVERYKAISTEMMNTDDARRAAKVLCKLVGNPAIVRRESSQFPRTIEGEDGEQQESVYAEEDRLSQAIFEFLIAQLPCEAVKFEPGSTEAIHVAVIFLWLGPQAKRLAIEQNRQIVSAKSVFKKFIMAEAENETFSIALPDEHYKALWCWLMNRTVNLSSCLDIEKESIDLFLSVTVPEMQPHGRAIGKMVLSPVAEEGMELHVIAGGARDYGGGGTRMPDYGYNDDGDDDDGEDVPLLGAGN